jgi:hypothetical protein
MRCLRVASRSDLALQARLLAPLDPMHDRIQPENQAEPEIGSRAAYPNIRLIHEMIQACSPPFTRRHVP